MEERHGGIVKGNKYREHQSATPTPPAQPGRSREKALEDDRGPRGRATPRARGAGCQSHRAHPVPLCNTRAPGPPCRRKMSAADPGGKTWPGLRKSFQGGNFSTNLKNEMSPAEVTPVSHQSVGLLTTLDPLCDILTGCCGHSPVLPFTCCVGSLRFVGCCGLCSC